MACQRIPFWRNRLPSCAVSRSGWTGDPGLDSLLEGIHDDGTNVYHTLPVHSWLRRMSRVEARHVSALVGQRSGRDASKSMTVWNLFVARQGVGYLKVFPPIPSRLVGTIDSLVAAVGRPKLPQPIENA